MNKIDTSFKKPYWRSQETHRSYMEDIEAGGLDNGCRLCERKSMHTFTHWKIIANKYPYDRVALLHEMIVPLRHTDGSDLTEAEISELSDLKQTFLNERYRYILEAMPKAKSIPSHFHLHLIVPNQE